MNRTQQNYINDTKKMDSRKVQYKTAEEKVFDAETIYKTVFDNSTVAITVADGNGNIIFWNKFTEILLGLTKKDLYNKPVYSLYPAGEWQKIQELDVHGNGSQHFFKTHVLHKNGELIDVGLSVTVLKCPEGKIAGSIGILTDIREYKKFEEQLRLSEEMYRTIFENSVIAITIADKNNNIIFWNQFTETLLGMDRNDLFLKPVNSLYPEEEWNRIKSLDISRKGTQHSIETHVISKRGDLLDINLSVNMLKSPDGKTTGSIGMMADCRELVESRKALEAQLLLVSEYKEKSQIPGEVSLEYIEAHEQTEDELHYIEKLYSSVFENSVVAITITNENEDIIFWNRHTENLLAMSHEDLYMKPVSILYPEDEWNKLRSQNIRQKGMQHYIETKMINKHNEIINVGLSVNVIKGLDEKITGSIGMITDLREITELRRLYANLTIDNSLL